MIAGHPEGMHGFLIYITEWDKVHRYALLLEIPLEIRKINMLVKL